MSHSITRALFALGILGGGGCGGEGVKQEEEGVKQEEEIEVAIDNSVAVGDFEMHDRCDISASPPEEQLEVFKYINRCTPNLNLLERTRGCGIAKHRDIPLTDDSLAIFYFNGACNLDNGLLQSWVRDDICWYYCAWPVRFADRDYCVTIIGMTAGGELLFSMPNKPEGDPCAIDYNPLVIF